MILPSLHTCTVAVIGLGYVGLPLAVELGKIQKCARTGILLQRRVIGFDINIDRIKQLKDGVDTTNEITYEQLKEASSLCFSNERELLNDVDVYIITVPTPIDSAKKPDLAPLIKASTTVAHAIRNSNRTTNPIVIYESTVYPGTTEEVCVPVLEEESGLSLNKDFYCGYSPERINPGDSSRKLKNITKITSGSNSDVSLWVDSFYGSIITAGTHQAPSIKVAESAKVIENTQRDLNIALINELSIIFRHLNIDTLDILEAAATKWNFLSFSPGLVGGHCIGVDPYYLTYKAEQVGYHPQIVLAGRRINDDMARWHAEKLILELAKRHLPIVGTPVLVLGLTFKENCPDLRNTKSIDFIKSLQNYGMEPHVVDPCVNPDEARREYDIDITNHINQHTRYHAVAVLVAHKEFVELTTETWESLLKSNGVLFDLKGIVPRPLVDIRP